uniref:Major sperm protein n=1 Tax=Trichuris muris TaxID=70415 RepID=A0A5S6Q0K2_TRIMR
MVEIKPTFVVFRPSYKESSVVRAVMINTSNMPITFKLKSTQKKYLTAFPTYGKVAPQGGHVFFIKLHCVGSSDFKQKRDRLSVHLAAMRRSVKRPNYAAFWHKPVGPPKVFIVKNIIVQYRPIKGNPPWDAFTSKLIKGFASVQIQTDQQPIVKKKVEKEKEEDQNEADVDEENDEEKRGEDDDKESEGKEDGDDLEDDEKKTVDEE